MCAMLFLSLMTPPTAFRSGDVVQIPQWGNMAFQIDWVFRDCTNQCWKYEGRFIYAAGEDRPLPIWQGFEHAGILDRIAVCIRREGGNVTRRKE